MTQETSSRAIVAWFQKHVWSEWKHVPERLFLPLALLQCAMYVYKIDAPYIDMYHYLPHSYSELKPNKGRWRSSEQSKQVRKQHSEFHRTRCVDFIRFHRTVGLDHTTNHRLFSELVISLVHCYRHNEIHHQLMREFTQHRHGSIKNNIQLYLSSKKGQQKSIVSGWWGRM